MGGGWESESAKLIAKKKKITNDMAREELVQNIYRKNYIIESIVKSIKMISIWNFYLFISVVNKKKKCFSSLSLKL